MLASVSVLGRAELGSFGVVTECNWRKLICSSVRLERLFVTNMQNQ